MGISFERLAQKVNESVGSIPVRLKSRGFYSKPFEMSFTCVEIAPVEAESGLFCCRLQVKSNIMSHFHNNINTDMANYFR